MNGWGVRGESWPLAGDAGSAIGAGLAAGARTGVDAAAFRGGARLLGLSSDFMKTTVTTSTMMHVRITTNVVGPHDDEGSASSPVS
jgi:hypothetical protein